MTTLGEQLQYLQRTLPQTRVVDEKVDRRKKVDSFLYTGEKAYEKTAEEIRLTAIQGLRELVMINAHFRPYAKTLLSPASTNIKRHLQTKDVNENIDKSLQGILRLLSPYFMIEHTHKVIEYLVRQYQVHIYNVDEVMACILPYHETLPFVSMIRILHITKNDTWEFLTPIKEKQVVLPRKTLIHWLSKEIKPLEFIAKNAKENVELRIHHPVFFSFYTMVACEYIAYVNQVDDVSLKRLLPYIMEGLTAQDHGDFQMASVMIMMNILSKMAIAEDVLDVIMENMVEGLNPFINLEKTIKAIAHLYQAQEYHHMPKSIYRKLITTPSIFETISKLSKTYYLGNMVAVLLTQIINEVLELEDLSILNQVIQVSDRNVIAPHISIVMDYLFKLFVHNTDKQNLFHQMTKQFKMHFGEEFDQAVNDTLKKHMTNEESRDMGMKFIQLTMSNASHVYIEKYGVSLISLLHHPSEEIRLQGLFELKEMMKQDADDTMKQFVSDILYQNLNLESMKVLEAILSFPNVTTLIPEDHMVTKLIELMQEGKDHVNTNAIFKLIVPMLTQETILMNDQYMIKLMPIIFNNMFPSTNMDVVSLFFPIIANYHELFEGLQNVHPEKLGPDAWHEQAVACISSHLRVKPQYFDRLVSWIDGTSMNIIDIIAASLQGEAVFTDIQLIALWNAIKPWLASIDEKMAQLLYDFMAHQPTIMKPFILDQVFPTMLNQREITPFSKHIAFVLEKIMKSPLAELASCWTTTNDDIAMVRMLQIAAAIVKTSHVTDVCTAMPAILLAVSHENVQVRRATIQFLEASLTHLHESRVRKVPLKAISATFEGMISSQTQILANQHVSVVTRMFESHKKEALDMMTFVYSLLSNYSEKHQYLILRHFRDYPFAEPKINMLKNAAKRMNEIAAKISSTQSEVLWLTECLIQFETITTDKAIINDAKTFQLIQDMLCYTDQLEYTDARGRTKHMIPARILGDVPLFHNLEPSHQVQLFLSFAEVIRTGRKYPHLIQQYQKLVHTLPITVDLLEKALLHLFTTHQQDFFLSQMHFINFLETLSLVSMNEQIFHMIPMLVHLADDCFTKKNVHFPLLKLNDNQQASYAIALLLTQISQCVTWLIDHMTTHMQDDKPTIPEALRPSVESIPIQFIMDILQHQSITNTKHEAISLLSNLSQLFPEQVAEHMSTLLHIFGQSLKSDTSSFTLDVIEQMMENLLPRLVMESDSLSSLLQRFISSMEHIHESRRLAFFEKLAYLVHPRQLYVMMILFFKNYLVTDNEMYRDFPAMLLLRFSMPKQLRTIQSLIECVCYLLDPTKPYSKSLRKMIVGDMLSQQVMSQACLYSIGETSSDMELLLTYEIVEFIRHFVYEPEFIKLMQFHVEEAIESNVNIQDHFLTNIAIFFIKSMAYIGKQKTQGGSHMLHQYVLSENKLAFVGVQQLFSPQSAKNLYKKIWKYSDNSFLKLRSLELFNAVLSDYTRENNEFIDHASEELLSLLKPLCHLLNHQMIDDDDDDVVYTIQHAASIAIELLARRLVDLSPVGFTRALKKLHGLYTFAEGQALPNLMSSLSMSMCTLMSLLKDESVTLELLPTFAPSLIQSIADLLTLYDRFASAEHPDEVSTFSPTTFSLHLQALLSSLRLLLLNFHRFMSPYFMNVLQVLFHPQMQLYFVKRKKKISRVHDAILKILSLDCSPRLLLSSMMKMYPSMVRSSSCESRSICAFFNLFQSVLQGTDSDTLKPFISDLESFMLEAFDYRYARFAGLVHEIADADVADEETHIVHAYKHFILKLDGKRFSSVLSHLLTWLSESPSSSNDSDSLSIVRFIMFFKVIYLLQSSIKSHFVTYWSSFLELAFSSLSSLSLFWQSSGLGGSRKKRCDFSSPSSDASHALLKYAFAAFQELFLYDDDGSFAESHVLEFLKLFQSQYFLHALSDFDDRIDNFVTPAWIQLALAVDSPHLKSVQFFLADILLSDALLSLPNDVSILIRSKVLDALQSLYTELDESLISFLPELFPILSELLSEASANQPQVVEQVTQFVNFLEDLTGEDIRQHLAL